MNWNRLPPELIEANQQLPALIAEMETRVPYAAALLARNDTDYSNRIYLDAWYVKNWSLWSDIVIMLKTINVVLSKRGAY